MACWLMPEGGRQQSGVWRTSGTLATMHVDIAFNLVEVDHPVTCGF